MIIKGLITVATVTFMGGHGYSNWYSNVNQLPLLQGILSGLVYIPWAIWSYLEPPFTDSNSDWLDVTGRVAALITMIFATQAAHLQVEGDKVPDYCGLITFWINVVNAIVTIGLCYSFTRSAQLNYKNGFGVLHFTSFNKHERYSIFSNIHPPFHLLHQTRALLSMISCCKASQSLTLTLTLTLTLIGGLLQYAP